MAKDVTAILHRIENARAAHTEAESDIFAAYITGTAITDSSVVGAIEDLIAADTKLAAALTDLLAAG
jgi:hypothetical protein